MLIDWFTVGAQALNFLILVWLLKHFLYKPVLNAIDAREKKVAAELADAESKKADAKKDRDEFQHKNEEFDEQRAELLSKAVSDAKTERQKLLDDARKAADALSAKRADALRTESANLNKSIRKRAQEEVFAIARKTLAELAGANLEERITQVFISRLRAIDGTVKTSIVDALKATPEAAIVRSAFELPPDQRAAIQKALNETFSADVAVKFETAPDLVSGIEFTKSGQKVAWSIADYLASLEKKVALLLKPDAKLQTKPATPADPSVHDHGP